MLSDKMLIARCGNFTASANHRLMAGWDKAAPDTSFPEFDQLYTVIKELDSKPLVGDIKNLFEFSVSGEMISKTWKAIQYEKPSQGLITYAEEKAIESFFYPDPSLNFSTVHTRNGEEREVECMALLSSATGLDFVNIGDDQVHIHSDEVGCTPDGIVLDDLDLVAIGAEVKCKSPLEHAKNILISNGEELKKNAFDHFVQVQTAMLVTGATQWYFASYNPYAKEEAMQFSHIVVDRDTRFIAILDKRLQLAKKIKRDFYMKIQSALEAKKQPTQKAAA